jgi:beta-lactamase regulating signal transducer with metallopeptidase domain
MSTNGAASVATSSTNATAGVATPSSDTQPSNDNAALIGGIVGGIVALLLVGGLIAFLVARNRRNANEQDNNKAMTNTTAASPAVSSNYDRIPTKISNFSDRVDAAQASKNHYDMLTPNEL